MICYIPKIQMPKNVSYAVSAKGKYWKVGETIEVYMDGDEAQKSMVKDMIKELAFVNLKFVYVNNPLESDVRITFTRGIGSWSYVGTDCLMIPKNQPTMNFGWMDYGTIRHEIGHMLGLLHEHKNPESNIQWNEEVVLQELSGPPNNWTEQQIRHNVLDPLNPTSVNFTSFDPNSVMLYSFPDHWTTNNKGTKSNNIWSRVDKDHLMKLYPFDNCLARINRWLESLT